MDFNIENYIEEPYGFETIRKQCEDQGLTSEVNIIEGKGVIVTGSSPTPPTPPTPTPSAHHAGEWYVYKDGVYSFLSNEDFEEATENGNVTQLDVVTEGKYTPVGIVAFDSNVAPDGKTRIVSLTSLFGEVDYAWGGYDVLENELGNESVSIPTLDFDGKGKCEALKEKYPTQFSDFIAAYAASEFKAFTNDSLDWYLPGGGEIYQTMCEKEVIDPEIDKYVHSVHYYQMQPYKLTNTECWSVSEYEDEFDNSYAWLWTGYVSFGFNCESKFGDYYAVRPFAIVD